MVRKFFEKTDRKLDTECGLIGVTVKEKNVIHTNVTGYAHYICENAIYTQLVYMNREESRYTAAEHIISEIIKAQDQDPESKTYGLWPHYFEEKLTEMSAPDYNMAEFISRPLIYIMLERSECISPETAENIKAALCRAARCCIKRNAGLDYTNVISMSCVTLILIGQLLNDEELINAGKEELSEFAEYTRFNGAFNEYNSPCYLKVVGDSIERIFKYCTDEESRLLASELNDCLWDMISKHYSTEFNELAPPFLRAYFDTDVDKENTDFIYYATDGKYGSYNCTMNDWELNVPKCPEKFYENFEKKLWLDGAYYKKNNLRKRNSDVTIVRNFESPDLIAYTYKTKNYLFGAFERTDLWDQRRTSMIMWDKENKKTFKLRCLKDGYSFSSAMAYTAMHKDEALTVVGFSTDHGYKHYILDSLNGGKTDAESLKFTMKISGEYKKENFARKGNELLYNDGKISFSVKITAWVFDGEPGEIRFTDDGFELVCYEGERKTLDLNVLGETYGVISMKINGEAPSAQFSVSGGRVSAETDKFAVEAYASPKPFNSCIKNAIVKKKI